MKLSVIVPIFNTEKYLRRCVDSLLAQTLAQPFEIILVNDGSTDGSQAILDEYATVWPDRIRTLAVENGGQGRARNLGIELARGDYLGFVDSDDWVDPRLYAALLDKLETEQADLAICGVLNCYDDGSTEQPMLWREGRAVAAAGSACNKLFRRDLVGAVRFPEGRLWYEDFAFSAKLLMRSRKTVIVPEPLYFYRIGHSSTMTNQNAKKNLDLLPIMEDIRSDMETVGASEDDFSYLVLNHVLLDAVNRLSLQHNPDKLEAIAKLRAYVRKHVPDLSACRAFREEPLNRRIVMRLNYIGLEDLSKLLIKLKKAL